MPVASLALPVGGLSLETLESAIIRFALVLHAGNRTQAARFLRVSRSALLYRMKKYRLDVPPPEHAGPVAKD